MPTLPSVDHEAPFHFLTDLLNTPSPTGLAEPAVLLVEKELSKFRQLTPSRTPKGSPARPLGGALRGAARRTHRACGYAGRGCQGDQAEWPAEAEHDRRTDSAERGNRGRMGAHFQGWEGARLGTGRHTFRAYLPREGSGDAARRQAYGGQTGCAHHHGLSNKLRAIAEAHDIEYRSDVHPFYGSDREALWRAGGDLAVALIGPGIDASHNYERTHIDALTATTRWVMAYLLAT